MTHEQNTVLQTIAKQIKTHQDTAVAWHVSSHLYKIGSWTSMHSTQLQAADSQASLKLCNNPLLACWLDNDGARLAVSHPPLLLLVLCLCHCAPQLGSLQQRPFSRRDI